jgi:hypothetical protein
MKRCPEVRAAGARVKIRSEPGNGALREGKGGEEMFRRTIHRGIAALSLVTFLAVAGAQPAAAASDAGFLGRLAGLWSAVAGGESDTLWNRLTGWLEGQPARPSAAKASSTTTEVVLERGGGIDPNGNRIVTDTEHPDGGN